MNEIHRHNAPAPARPDGYRDNSVIPTFFRLGYDLENPEDFRALADDLAFLRKRRTEREGRRKLRATIVGAVAMASLGWFFGELTGWLTPIFHRIGSLLAGR